MCTVGNWSKFINILIIVLLQYKCNKKQDFAINCVCSLQYDNIYFVINYYL